ncbi:MAG: RNA methyltransferase [Chloroflexi bacterium]|nr:RNA methyltransferase [Chloroflexota bacterium]
MITSPHNAKLKLVRALAGRPKERRAAGAFLAEGVRLVEDAFAAQWPFQFVLFSSETSNRGKKLVEQIQASGVDVDEVAPEILRAASETEASQGLLAVLKLTDLPLPDQLNFVLIPDQIRDPGNLGTLIRTAAAAGAQAVFIPPETTDPFAPKVVRAGMGAHFHLAVCSLGWDEIRAHITGLTAFLADAEGQTSCWGADFSTPCALIVGGEADGASQSAKNLANVFVNIPMPGKIESLNAGVAGAVLMFEVVRQRSEAR